MNDCEQKIRELEQKVIYALDELDDLYRAFGAAEDAEGRLVLARLEKIEKDVAGIKKAIDYDAQNMKSRHLARVYAIVKKLERKVE
ncbi:hypothetical protein [Thermococcus sp.]|uniref:hypothetical protein n=1 Tax=Thermococcus sp. TaxID=35749 RepID=UPI0025DADCB7|nr:hypothetical protein [Thermococcus sp.]